MKNSWYMKFRKQLVIRFLIIMCCISGILLVGIIGIAKNATLLANKGALKSGDFYYFYLQHIGEVNAIAFTVCFVCVLIFFIHSFFKSMEELLSCMEGKKKKKKPLLFYLFPQFMEAQKYIETLLEQRIWDEQIYLSEKEHKHELLMYLAHDLKTPLTSMIGYMNHILDHHIDEEDEKKSLHIAYTKANRLNELIDEFAEILRYDDKVSQLNITSVNLSSLLEQQLAGFDPLLEEKDLIIQKNIPSECIIEADYDKLQRVFDNLMKNAINYTSAHTVISIDVLEKQNGIELIYRNQVQNMSEEEVSHLFDKFYRVQTERSSTSGGAGLGLAIAREIMELHHGKIHASLEKNDIVFHLFLPYYQENIV